MSQKKCFEILFNHTGASLAGTLVAAGLMAVLALASLALFNTNLMQQKYVEQKYASVNVHKDIYEQLSNSTACTATFTAAGQILNRDDIDVSPEEFSFTSIKAPDSSDAFRKYVASGDPAYDNDMIRIDGLVLKNYMDQGLDGNNRFTATAVLEVRYKQNTRTIGPEVFRPKQMKIHFTFKRTDVGPPAGPDVANNKEVHTCKAVGGIGDSFWSLTASGDGIYYGGGRVGINTAVPNANTSLDVVNDSSNGSVARFMQTNTTNSNGIHIVTNGVNPVDLVLLAQSNAGANDVFAVRNSGEVGVGTRSPRVKLDVVGGIRPGNQANTTVCDNQTEGVMRYNTVDKIMEYCDGNGSNTWRSLTPSIKQVSRHCDCGPANPSGSPTCLTCAELGSSADWISTTRVTCPAGYTAFAANGFAQGTEESISAYVENEDNVRCRAQSWGASGNMSTNCIAICLKGTIRIDP